MNDNSRASLFEIRSAQGYLPWLAIGSIIIATVISLIFEGRVWWCQSGDYLPWSWEIWTSHNSQHLIDPYSFTHVLHGILEFWLIGLIFPRLPIAWRLVISIFIESSWEVAENSAYIIERYRATTISLDYFGDSILNSTADIVCCGIGFVIGWQLKFWRSLFLFLATEIVLIFWIHDSLLINILMLIYPIDAIRRWQMGG